MFEISLICSENDQTSLLISLSSLSHFLDIRWFSLPFFLHGWLISSLVTVSNSFAYPTFNSQTLPNCSEIFTPFCSFNWTRPTYAIVVGSSFSFSSNMPLTMTFVDMFCLSCCLCIMFFTSFVVIILCVSIPRWKPSSSVEDLEILICSLDWVWIWPCFFYLLTSFCLIFSFWLRLSHLVICYLF